MTIWARLRALTDIYRDDADVARQALEDMRVRPAAAREELLPVLTWAASHQRRQPVHRAERIQSQRRGLGVVLSRVDQWRDLLDQGFTVGGRYVFWGDATEDDHLERIAELQALVGGIQATIQLHQDAIDAIRAAHVRTLRQIEGDAA